MNSNFQHQQQGDEAIALGKENQVVFEEAEEEVLLEGACSDVVLDSLPLGSVDISTNVEDPKEACTPQNGTSPVWKHFILKNIDGRRKSVCLLCSKEIFFNGTSNLWKHLASKHSQHCLKLRKQEEQLAQKNIKSFFSFSSEVSKQAIITNTIVSELICRDLQPFSIVEDDGFIAYTKLLCPTYSMPSRKYISTTILDQQYEMVSLFSFLNN
jgi:hypothetical protein